MGLTRRDALGALLASGVGLLGGGTAYALYNQRLTVARASLPVAGLPETLKGLRIGLITDLHHSATVPLSLIHEAVAALSAEHADLIVLGGDYVTLGDSSYVAPVVEALAPLTAPEGVFAILGNHDYTREMPLALSRCGFEVLRDQRTRIRLRGEPIELAGLQYRTRGFAEVGRVVHGATAPVILLAHDPRRLNEAADLQVPLVLSGHTHGGQVVLPVLGAVAARKFPVLAGTAIKKKTTLFVSRGVGTVVVPFRLNCPPDVAVLTLEPRNA